jgi:hypothetical protein
MAKAVIVSLVAVGAVAAGALLLAKGNPATAAKVKCEFAIEDLTRLNVSTADVARARVSGDEFNGTVRMPFTIGSTAYVGECVFQHGSFHRVTLNGQLLAGR